MPMQERSSSVLAMLGGRFKQAVEAHKSDGTEFSSFGELPAGIENGIAQLVTAKFDLYKTGDLEGQPFCYLAGSVFLPKEFTDAQKQYWKTEGLFTSLTLPLCDTPNSGGKKKTLDDHVAVCLNELRKLGLDTSEMGSDPEELEEGLRLLVDTAPFFKFRTWKGGATPEYPNPRTNHVWNGIIDYTPEDTATNETQDNSGPPPAQQTTRMMAPKAPAPVARQTTAPAAATRSQPPVPTQTAPNGRQTAPVAAKPAVRATAPPVAAKPKTLAPKPSPVPEPVDASNVDMNDLGALGVRADGGDTTAQDELKALALGMGIPEESVDAATDWTTLAQALTEGLGQDSTTVPEPTVEPEPEQVTAPEVEQVCSFSPNDPKNPGKVLKQRVDCVITSVDEAKQTVSLKSLADGKTLYKGVKWDRLMDPTT